MRRRRRKAHDECRSRIRGTRYEERERFYDRWKDVLNSPDPYYSPRFDRALPTQGKTTYQVLYRA